MCSKYYKKRNFMLPVKTGIPPNNDGTFMKPSAMESQEN